MYVCKYVDIYLNSPLFISGIKLNIIKMYSLVSETANV